MIIAAALKIGKTIVSAPCLHAFCYGLAFQEGLMPQRTESKMTKEDWKKLYLEIGLEEGFITDNGTFLDRFEAADYALKTEQTHKDYISSNLGELHVPDVMFA